MCRLYGQISVRPSSAEDFLIDSKKSLLRLSNLKKTNPQKDGWGIGIFAGGAAKIVKSPKPVFKEAGRFRSIAAKTRSPILIGHLRAASNPRGLAHKKLISLNNSQPFTDGKIIFAHNGTLQIPDEVTKFLGKYRKNILGNNDSEVFFWQFKKFLDAYGSIPEALEACVREIWSLWEGCKSRYPKKKSPFTGLNTLVSDGRSLHALSHYKSHGCYGIANPKQPWGTMSFARRGGRIVLASEDMDSGHWTHFGPAEIVSASNSGGRLEIKKKRLAVKA